MPFWRKKAQATVDRQRQVDLGYAARRLAEGDLSLIVGFRTDTSIALTLRNISHLAPQLGHADGRIKEKISRGISFYVTQPQAGPSDELVEVDRGTLSITIGELLFSGKSRHFSAGFDAIGSISHSQKGIAITRRNGTQKLFFEASDDIMIPLKVQDREYSLPLSGKLMRLLIEAVIKHSFEARRGS